MKIFYSWQSDLPNKTNRGLIQGALEQAARQIQNDESLQVQPVIDRDTLGRPGAPNISEAIFEKITEADIFVADVSIINSDAPLERQTPNPNVLIELGYAIARIGWENIIPVQNLAFGIPTVLPFDLRHRKITCYRLKKEEEPKDVRKQLTSSLKGALVEIIAHLRRPPQAIHPDLTLTDSNFLKAVFQSTFSGTGMHGLIEYSNFENAMNSLNLTMEQALESIEILDSLSMIGTQYNLGGGFPIGTLTSYGIGLCMENFIPNGMELEWSILSAFVNEGLRNGQDISISLGSNIAVTNYALFDLETKGLLTLDSHLGSQSYVITGATAHAKRIARNKQQPSVPPLMSA